MSYRLVVPVQSASGFQNGLAVTAWAVSRFGSAAVPAEGAAVPSGLPDATGTTSTIGGPGQAVLDLPNNVAYNICVTDANGVNWWTQTSEAVGGAAATAVQSVTSSDGSITVGGTGTAPTVSLPVVGTAGTYGDASHTVVITTDAKGRVSGVTVDSIAVSHAAITDWATAISSALSGYFNTAGSGLTSSGSTVSLPAVGSAGTTGDASHTLTVTIDAYGRVSGVTANSIAIAISQVTGLSAALATIPTTFVSTFNTRSGAVTLTKADVTGTGLTYTDVGADASGAAASAQAAAQTYADRYAGSAAGTASRPLAATDASVTNSRTPTGTAGGDLNGSYPIPTLAAAYAGSSPVGSATAVPILTIDGKGRITATSTAAPSDTTKLAIASNLSDLNDAGTARFNAGVSQTALAAAVAVANQSGTFSAGSVTGAPTTIDGYSLQTGDWVLLVNQTTLSQNGLWQVTSSTNWSRPNEFAHGASTRGRSVKVMAGTGFASTDWILNTTAGAVTIDTTSQIWTQVGARGLLYSQELASAVNLATTFGAISGWTANLVPGLRPLKFTFSGWVYTTGTSKTAQIGMGSSAGSYYNVNYASLSLVASAITPVNISGIMLVSSFPSGPGVSTTFGLGGSCNSATVQLYTNFGTINTHFMIEEV